MALWLCRGYSLPDIVDIVTRVKEPVDRLELGGVRDKTIVKEGLGLRLQ